MARPTQTRIVGGIIVAIMLIAAVAWGAVALQRGGQSPLVTRLDAGVGRISITDVYGPKAQEFALLCTEADAAALGWGVTLEGNESASAVVVHGGDDILIDRIDRDTVDLCSAGSQGPLAVSEWELLATTTPAGLQVVAVPTAS